MIDPLNTAIAQAKSALGYLPTGKAISGSVFSANRCISNVIKALEELKIEVIRLRESVNDDRDLINGGPPQTSVEALAATSTNATEKELRYGH